MGLLSFLAFLCVSAVAKEVTGRQHKIDIAVKLITKRKATPVKKRCLLLQGIPDGATSEHLSMVMENASGADEPKLQYGENPGTAICTFQEEIEGNGASSFESPVDQPACPDLYTGLCVDGVDGLVEPED